MQAFCKNIISTFRSQLQHFRMDQGGVSAIEFALILPVMAILAVSSWEITKAVMTKRKNSNVATSIANVAAQDAQITASDWTTLGEIADKIYFPYNNFTHRLGMIAVQIDRFGKLNVLCRYGTAKVDEKSLPAAMQIKNSYYIMVTAEVDFLSLNKDMRFYGASPGIMDMTFRDSAIFSPRNTGSISCE